MEPKRSKLGNQLGALFCLAGFVLIWVGWNGAASYDTSIRQFPYLISGGIAGLCLVQVGVSKTLRTIAHRELDAEIDAVTDKEDREGD